MNNKIIIFGTSTPRSGGTLVSNILSAHKDIIITKDLVHFFRHIYNKFSPIKNKSKQYQLVYEMCLRIKIRKKIILSPKEILKTFKSVKNYSNIVDCISAYLLKKNKTKKIIGETANGEWRNVENFLKLSSNYKSFQVIRDPRAVLMSWKKLTYSSGYKYLNIIFNWIDAINYSEKNLKKFKSNRYLRLKFEDIHSEPKKNIQNICKFAGVKVDKNMLLQKKWPKLLRNSFNSINVSSYNNKHSFGFSRQRTTNWIEHIENWELALTQYLLKDYLKKLNYQIIPVDKKYLKIGLNIIKKDKLLKKNLRIFKTSKKGTDKRLNDPTKPENWAAVDTSKDISARFIDTKDYNIYLRELRKIKKNSKKIKNYA